MLKAPASISRLSVEEQATHLKAYQFARAAMPTVAEALGERYTPQYQEAFPDIKSPYFPFGALVLLQLRQPRAKIGSIHLPNEVEDIERYRTQAALVRAVGFSGFCDRSNGAKWVEGEWYTPGDFVRCPMFGGDRFDVKWGGKDSERTTFVFIKDYDALALVVGDPLNVTTS